MKALSESVEASETGKEKVLLESEENSSIQQIPKNDGIHKNLPLESLTIRQRKQVPSKSSSKIDHQLSRSLQQQQQHESLRFDDHFTLRQPSSCVTFRGESIYIYELRSSQMQMRVSQPLQKLSQFHSFTDKEGQEPKSLPESCYPPLKIEMKDVQLDRNEQISAVRLTYTIVSLFCMATFFCFSFLVILFLFMDLVADVGLNGVRTVFLLHRFLGTLLAIPIFLYGFSSLLTVWQFFISESWKGFPFLRNIVTNLDEVIIEWVTLTMMLGAPVVTLVINLFLKSDKWWENTIFVWYISVSLFFAAFTIAIVSCETETAWLIIFNNAKDEIRQSSRWSKIKYFVGHALKRTQEEHYCGYMERPQMMGSVVVEAGNDDDDKVFMHSHKFWLRWHTQMTHRKCLSWFFEPIEPPQKVFSVDEILSNRRFFTKDNWSIEKSLCSSSWSQHVPVVKGPGALKESQIISSVVCIGLSILALLLVISGALRWLDLPMGSFAVFLLLIIMLCFPNFVTLHRFLSMMKKQMKKEKEDGDGAGSDDIDNPTTDDGIYQIVETYRVSRPTRMFRRINTFLHFGLFHIFPLITLILLENYPVLFLFIIVSIWSCIRYWFDPVNMLNYHGDFGSVRRSKNEVLLQEWRDKCRVNNILLNVTRAYGTKMYITIFLVLILGIFTLAVGELGFETVVQHTYADTARLTPRGDFAYLPQPNLKYPTCSLMNNADILNSTETTLIDYNFLADIIYQEPTTYQGTLDEWFGPGVAKAESQIVSEYRKTLTAPNLAVNYDIVSFGDRRKVVVVRGSSTSWEWLTDAQLWAGVALMQLFLSLLPAGDLFNPILDDVLLGMGFIESKHLKEIQLNSQTTGFVNYIRDTIGFNGSLSITGHSLGGGISLITGAQTNISAIGISGPNNVFSRKTFDPVLDLETINTFLFNVVPERDIVPIIDQPGLLTQRVACRAKANDFLDCHHATRTLCELMFKCGSFDRPVPCDCAVRHGYPVPKQISGDRSFSDICGKKRTNDGSSVPYDDDDDE